MADPRPLRPSPMVGETSDRNPTDQEGVMDTVSREDYEAMMRARDTEKANHERVAAELAEAHATIRRYKGDGVPLGDRLLTTAVVWHQTESYDCGDLDAQQVEYLRDFAIELLAGMHGWLTNG